MVSPSPEPVPNVYRFKNVFLPAGVSLDETASGQSPVPGKPKGSTAADRPAVLTVPPARLEVEWEEAHLLIDAFLPEPLFREALLTGSNWWLNDRLELLLGLRNTARLLQIVLFPSGTAVTNLVEVRHNHLVCDVGLSISRCDLPVDFSVKRDEASLSSVFHLRLRTDTLAGMLGEEPAGFVRANVMRYRAVGGEEITYWQRPGAAGFIDGRSLGFWWRRAPEFVLEGIGWKPWKWGGNEVAFTVRNASAKALPARLSTVSQDGAVEHVEITVPPEGTERGSCAFRIDPMRVLDGEWGLSMGDAGLRFPLGWKRGFPGRFRCGHGVLGTGSPAGTSPFLEKADGLLRRLPAFERRAGGVLVVADECEIDLMKPGAVGGLVRIAAERFEGRDDRLAALTLMVNDPAVFISSAALESRTRLPEGILASGGGMCRAASVLLAGLVSGLPGEEPACLIHVGSPGPDSGLPSHYFAGARRDGRVVPLDAELGRFFLNGGGALASLDEIVADPALAEASGSGLSAWFKQPAASTLSLRAGPVYW